ncbi:MAG TPA: phosphoribosylformylglycinamidine synthase subunit PurQ [Bdellovibrionales bacterium]|nr:phosphoribosylformylglycinamidine synthase subunit PurQ [Bdellovibrionales bacterium]
MSGPVGVLRFPGTNCDRDVFEAVEGRDLKAEWLWHADRFDAKKYRALLLPGGFSYGDYLRAGALAARAPAMDSVREAAKAGVPVLGICNGFQILCEAGLLPGVLIRNRGLRFIDDWVELKLESQNPVFAAKMMPGTKVNLPIAHADGRFYAEGDDLKMLQDRGQVWWSYLDNPNGAIANIAGVMNEKKNVAALMPHPERAMYDWMGGTDGRTFFEI